MNRKHFILASALSGLVAAILPKRGESASKFLAPGIPSGASAGAIGDIKGCLGCGLIETCKCIAPVTVPEPQNELPKLCIFDTPDGFTVIPKYLGSQGLSDPLNQRASIGVRWSVGGVNYGTWFRTNDENMLFDAEVLLYYVRKNYTLGGQRLVAGETPAQVTDNEVARLRAEYRAHVAETTQALFPRPERTAAGSLLSL